MSNTSMVGEIVIVFVKLLTEVVQAKDDAEKQEDALMTAEEQIAHIRAKNKFG